MKMVLLGGLLIILPAVAVVLFFWGSAMMIPALASLFVAALPFAGFAVLLRGSAQAGDDEGEH